MTATIHLIQWRSTDASTLGGSTTDFSFLSADLAGDPDLVDAACRVTNSITIPTSGCAYSYEIWLSACISASPDNNVSNFQVWGTAPAQAYPTGTCWLVSTATSGAGSTPVVTSSSIATSSLTDATSDSKYTWDSASYAAAACETNYLIMQLQVTTTASAGHWGGANGCALSYSYDEV